MKTAATKILEGVEEETEDAHEIWRPKIDDFLGHQAISMHNYMNDLTASWLFDTSNGSLIILCNPIGSQCSS